MDINKMLAELKTEHQNLDQTSSRWSDSQRGAGNAGAVHLLG
jgi:hypothetical protein